MPDLLTGGSARLRRWRQARIDAAQARVRTLEDAFGLRLRPGPDEPIGTHDKALALLLPTTLRSLASVQGPLSGFLEAGLLFKRLERARVEDAALTELRTIDQANEESKAAHRRLADLLLRTLLGERADLVFSEEALGKPS